MNDVRWREHRAKLEEALATGDLSALTATERCACSWELAQRGEWDHAERVAASITDDEDERGQALAILAVQLARAGVLDRAERTALQITADPTFFGAVHEKLVALVECASVHASRGQAADASRLLGHALADLPAFTAVADWEAADCLVDVAQVLGQLGEKGQAAQALERAAALAPSIHQDQAQILERIAGQFAALSLRDRARAIAESIPVPARRSRALKGIEE